MKPRLIASRDSWCVVAVGLVMGVGPGIAQVGNGVSNLEHVVTRDLASEMPEVAGDLAPVQHPLGRQLSLIGELLEGVTTLTPLHHVAVVSCVDHPCAHSTHQAIPQSAGQVLQPFVDTAMGPVFLVAAVER